MTQSVRKTSRGKQKIEITKIQNKSTRQVTFSKRHDGLFKKAAELSVLTGAHAAVITFTEAGKPYSVGYPSVDAVLQRYLNGNGNNVAATDDLGGPGSSGGKPRGGGFLWDRPIEGLGLDELEHMKIGLEELKAKLASRVCDHIVRNNNHMMMQQISDNNHDHQQQFIMSQGNGFGLTIDPAMMLCH